MTKYCSACHRLLPLTAFARHRGAADGHQGYCRACERVYQRKRYARQRGYLWVEDGQARPWPPAARGG
jgi:hypothetical protein